MRRRADNPANFVVSWQAGTPLPSAIAQTLKTALPNLKQTIQIGSNLVLSYDEKGVYQSLKQFAPYVNAVTKSLTPGGKGVHIATKGDAVLVWDGSVQPAANAVKQIQFQDMLGQPTWIDPQTIMVKLVLRGDLELCDVISIPPSIATTSAASYLRFQDKSSFTGRFVISQLHHWGNFRTPEASAWNTTVWAFSQPAGAAP